MGKGRKGKKKTFTTPKKTHHEKKKEPLSVLKLYKIDEASSNVEQLRTECPGSDCGPGTFMADHSDRLSCGKCGLTYFHDAPLDVGVGVGMVSAAAALVF